MSNTGCRIYTKINRASREQVESFRGMPVANIADNCGRIFAADSAIRPFNKTEMLGTAFTVKCPQGDNLFFHKALDMAQPGDILVIASFGTRDRALCGEIMIQYAISKGLRGFVVDGAIRDCEAAREIENFSVYARAVQPNGPYKNGPGEINVPVSVGGVIIYPGDILVGDSDGFVAISPAEAADIHARTAKTMEIEKKAFADIAAGCYNRDWVDAKLQSLNCEVIDAAWND